MLAENVTNSRGEILFKTGDTISQKHLKALKAWGVTEVKIRAVDGLNLQEKSPEAVDENSRGKMDWLFQKTDKDDPIIQELYRLGMKKLVETEVIRSE